MNPPRGRVAAQFPAKNLASETDFHRETRMGVPVSQMVTVARYVIGKTLRREKRYPLVLMLEPLFRCNLACAGCGKIQYPADILKKQLSPEECFHAVDECGAPMVSIPGGEPLLHPQMDQIVEGLVARKKYIYLCTNALLLEKQLHRFKPSKYLTFSVHVDGPREEHDVAVCREGVFDIAVRAIRVAVAAGFRVTTNTTMFNTAHPRRMREMFDILTDLGVEGMMISPGYAYEKAPDQDHFLQRAQTVELFRRTLARPKRGWVFNQSPLFLEFLKGNWDLECTPWGNPTYNIFGWQRLWPTERQSQMPGLHGALRLRADGCVADFRILARIGCGRATDVARTFARQRSHERRSPFVRPGAGALSTSQAPEHSETRTRGRIARSPCRLNARFRRTKAKTAEEKSSAVSRHGKFALAPALNRHNSPR